jgi:hypothetical protein
MSEDTREVLRAWLAAIERDQSRVIGPVSLPMTAARVDALRQALADVEDARRYRYMRNAPPTPGVLSDVMSVLDDLESTPAELDAVIDAAITADREGPK